MYITQWSCRLMRKKTPPPPPPSSQFLSPSYTARIRTNRSLAGSGIAAAAAAAAPARSRRRRDRRAIIKRGHYYHYYYTPGKRARLVHAHTEASPARTTIRNAAAAVGRNASAALRFCVRFVRVSGRARLFAGFWFHGIAKGCGRLGVGKDWFLSSRGDEKTLVFGFSKIF